MPLIFLCPFVRPFEARTKRRSGHAHCSLGRLIAARGPLLPLARADAHRPEVALEVTPHSPADPALGVVEAKLVLDGFPGRANDERVAGRAMVERP